MMFYGPRPNSELLVHSGFVMDGNPHDYMLLKLGVGKNDPLKPQKETLLSALTIPTSGDFSINRAGEPDPQLNAFIRINAMTAAELQGCMADPPSCATLGNPDGVVNEENETRACLFFETRCKLLLMAYRSTVADDDALLADPKIAWHKRCAIQLRRSEKLMLTLAAEKVALRGLDEEL